MSTLPGRPKRASAGTGALKVENPTTQPVWLGLPAPGHVLEVPADVAPLGNGDVAAQQQRRDQALADALAVVDAVVDQLAQQVGALRVADQDHAAAVVVPAQVVLPGADHVAVGELRLLGGRRASGEDRRQGQLAVHRREHPAPKRVAGRLVERDRALLGIDREIRVRGRVVGDRRVDVEAVGLRLARGAQPVDAEHLARRRDPGRVHPRLARVRADPGLAQPDGRVGSCRSARRQRQRAQARRRHDALRQSPPHRRETLALSRPRPRSSRPCSTAGRSSRRPCCRSRSRSCPSRGRRSLPA